MHVDIFLSCVGQPGDYRLAIALASQGKVELKPLVTHRYTWLYYSYMLLS